METISRLPEIISSVSDDELKNALTSAYNVIEDVRQNASFYGRLKHVSSDFIKERQWETCEKGRGKNIQWFSLTDWNNHWSDLYGWNVCGMSSAYIMVAERNDSFRFYIFENDSDKSVYVFTSNKQDFEVALFSLWAYWGSQIRNKRQYFGAYSYNLPGVIFCHKFGNYEFMNYSEDPIFYFY